MESRNLAAISWVTLILGIVLIVAPWVFGFDAAQVAGSQAAEVAAHSQGSQTLHSLIGGILISLSSLLALLGYRRRWPGWVNFVLLNMVFGAYVFIAPLLFHYIEANAATWVHMILGPVVAALAVIQMWIIAGDRSELTLAP